MTKRGLQIGGQFRYLLGDDTSPLGGPAGEMNAEFLPHDRVTARDALRARVEAQRAVRSRGSRLLQLNKVSDDKYFADFADRIADHVAEHACRATRASSPRPGRGRCSRARQSFQTLQDPNAPVDAAVQPLPQISGTLTKRTGCGLTWSGIREYARFTQDALAPTGERFVLYPTARCTQGAAWFFTARAGVHCAIRPRPDDAAAAGAAPELCRCRSRASTRARVRARHALLDTRSTQTLEPRAFYVYIPYKTRQAPVFDTALDDFNFSQLFAENRYIGNDRIGDANQLTLALTSRFSTATPAPSAAPRRRPAFYFADQRVSLNEPLRSAVDVRLPLSARRPADDGWSLASLLQYNFDARESSASTRRSLHAAPGRALNATWRYTRSSSTRRRDRADQADRPVGQWPITIAGR
jgi:LPS-assembly protein